MTDTAATTGTQRQATRRNPSAVAPPGRPSFARRLGDGRTVPVLTVLLVLVIVWYAAAIWLNGGRAALLMRGSGELGWLDYVWAVWNMDRPTLPSPHQLAIALWDQIAGQSITSNRSAVFHAGVTLGATVLGFAIGTTLGVVLAAGIVHVRTLDRSLMPWVIASQTIPILALAPILVVVLGQLGLTGVWPKALVATYLSFFPVTIGMVKGFRSPEPMNLDLMHTYSANRWQVFWKLRWPAAVPFLFPSLKVGIALSIVGAIVAEVSTSAQAGLGAWLLQGSYHGLVLRMWGALFVASALAIFAIGAVGLAERGVRALRGGQA
jgi:NitT/TauT family transport system permease protein